jgi:hypothetical protein
MTITVTPETFSFVSFDSAYIARIATHVAEQLGLTDIDIEIAVDETSPLTRIDVEVTDSLISIRPLSGALEDTRRPRQQSELATTLAMSRSMGDTVAHSVGCSCEPEQTYTILTPNDKIVLDRKSTRLNSSH